MATPTRSFSLRLALVLLYVPSLAGGAAAPSYDPVEMAVVRQIHAQITAPQDTATPGTKTEEFAVYSQLIPETAVFFPMTPIPGGSFLMGSPDDEPSRSPDEGPQKKVTVSPFWMGAYLVTWDEFELFMYPDRNVAGERDGGRGEELLDALSHPTAPYVEMSFGMGKDRSPAISMTHHAARKYTQWLSAKTGHFYRLPTEAEWEYAARAGSTTAYFFGNDPAPLDQHAWSAANSGFKYQQIGLKKPNPWGLYDMHGNVWEWTLDQYVADGYQRLPETGAVDPWTKPTTIYPRTVRGGSWDDDAEDLRSAARRGSNADWKMLDPQIPQSIWYHTNALWLGFRILRPQEVPTPEEMYEYWNL